MSDEHDLRRRLPSGTAPDAPDPESLPDPPAQRFSVLRLVGAVALLLVIAGATVLGLRFAASSSADNDAAHRSGAWFAPYVDVTLTPTSAFQSTTANPSRNVVLGFIVADKQRPCAPSWGTYQSLDEAAATQDLDRRVAQLRGQGGNAIVSFGGQANRELAVACSDQDVLTNAYKTTLRRYAANTADFDIEGAALTDTAANARRAAAVKELQDDARHDGDRLAVWLTLPVTPQGLNAEGLEVVRGMLGAGVDLTGVNVMAMDFGGDAGKDMRGSIVSAAQGTHNQLQVLYRQHGMELNSRQLWRRVGLTVMIGQNDVKGERVTVKDARAVLDFARENDLGRLSHWSLNRDQECGVTFPVVGTLSNLCSGVKQKKLQFTTIFDRFTDAKPDPARPTPSTALPRATTATNDDPAKSPYPIWSPQQAYAEGHKVVWHQAVYQARWYTRGQTPDAPTDPANHPWTLVGPVLRSDRAPTIPRLKRGTHPAWSKTKAYRVGARVLYHGLPYQATWHTTGEVPGQQPADGSPSAWTPLFTIPGEPKAADR